MSSNKNSKLAKKPYEPKNIVQSDSGQQKELEVVVDQIKPEVQIVVDQIKPEVQIVAAAQLEAYVKPDDQLNADAQDADNNACAEVKKFKTNHNGLFFIDGVEFKEDEVKELSSEQLESQRVKHAIEIGSLIEV
jgi:hypothetical protein